MCACAAESASPLEAAFPIKSLVLTSLFVVPGSRSHKPLTSSGPGVRAAWVLNRGSPVWRDFQKSDSASAAKGWMAGGTGAPMPGSCSGQGTRRE